MKATPNVKTLLIVEDEYPMMEKARVLIDFGAIASNLTKLESFGWTIGRFGYQDLLHILDEVITGFPATFCRKMSAKFRNKDHLTADELATYQSKRHNPSILDLHGKLNRIWKTKKKKFRNLIEILFSFIFLKN